MLVADCCSAAVVVAQRGTGVVEAAKLMREFHVGTVVVVDPACGNPVPIGMITDRDLVLEVLADEVQPAGVTLGDIMMQGLVTAQAGDDLLETLERMRCSGIRRMPVVDEAGTLAGILSVDDILETLADAIGRVPQLARNQQAFEKQRRR
jgi:CBS domain-containing protein